MAAVRPVDAVPSRKIESFPVKSVFRRFVCLECALDLHKKIKKIYNKQLIEHKSFSKNNAEAHLDFGDIRFMAIFRQKSGKNKKC